MKCESLSSVCHSESTDCGGVNVVVQTIKEQYKGDSGRETAPSTWEEEKTMPVTVRAVKIEQFAVRAYKFCAFAMLLSR